MATLQSYLPGNPNPAVLGLKEPVAPTPPYVTGMAPAPAPAFSPSKEQQIVQTPELAKTDIATKTAAIDSFSQQATLKQQAAQAAPLAVPQPEKLATLVDPTNPNNKIVVPVGSAISNVYTSGGWKLMGSADQTSAQSPAAGQPKAEGAATGAPAGEAGAAPAADKTPEELAAAKTSEYASHVQADIDAAYSVYKTYEDNVNQIRNGTFPLTPEQQIQLDDITNSYKQLIEEQKLANQNYTMAVAQVGLSMGRNIYAPNIELGNIQQAVNLGLSKIQNLEGKMKSEVAKAKQAIADNNYKMLNETYDKYSALQKEHTEALKSIQEETQREIENARAEHNQKLDDAKFNFEVEKYNNQPILDADKRIQETVMDLVNKYPDAGIDENDTLASATQKVRQSASYKAELEKTLTEAQKARETATGTAPTLRLKGQDEYGMNIYEEYDPATKSWVATSSETAEKYAGQAISGTDAYSTAVSAASEKVVSGLQVAQQKAAFRKDINSAYQQGNPTVVVDKIKSAAKDAMGIEGKTRLEGSEKALEVLPRIKNDIAQYISGGGSLNIFTGTLEEIAGKVGTVKDAELRRLASEIQTYLMDYRRSMTGAQFSESETNEYKYILPTLKDTVTTATARIDGFIKAKSYDIDASYSTLLGKENWNQLKQMSGYKNTIDRAEYDKMVSSVGQPKADEVLKNSQTWIVDSPKAEAPATGGEIKAVSIGGSTVKVSSQIASKIESADNDFFKATGKHLQINQSYRTREQQAKLYAELSPKGARVAKPGTSYHEKGLAIDVTNWKEAEPYLRKYGLVNPMSDDKGHFSYGEFS